MSALSSSPSRRRYAPQHAKTGHTASLATTGLAAVLLPLVLSTGTASADPGVPAEVPAASEATTGALDTAAAAPVAETAPATDPAAGGGQAPASVSRVVAQQQAPRARVTDQREATELKISGPTTQAAGHQTIAAGQLFAGKPLAGETVELQIERAAGEWLTIARAATDQHGVARMNYQLGSSTRVRTFFAGDAGLKPTASEAPAVTVQAPPAPVATLGERAVQEAAKHHGKTYRYGSTGPRTFDCSGLTGYVFRQLGVNLPRTSGQQQRAVRQVPVSEMRTGDLVFTWTRGRVTHVGIWDASLGKMWAATKTGDIVRPQAIWSSNITVGRVG